MSFQTKLWVTNFLLIILLVVVFGTSFYQYSAGIFENNAFSNLAVISEKISQQLDNLVRPMDLIITYLLSSDSFISSMITLSNLDRDNPRNLVYINEAMRTIKSSLMSYSIDKNFYRVSVFNDKGDFFSSNFRTPSISREYVLSVLHNLHWIDKSKNYIGEVIIIPPYKDPWIMTNDTVVFGVARSIQGTNGSIGYIEVQNPYDELKKIFAVSDSENTKVIAFTKEGDIFYNSGITDNALIDYYSSIPAEVDKTVYIRKNSGTGKDEILATIKSNYTGIKIVLVQDKDALLKPLLFTGNVTIVIGVIVINISFIYIYLFSRQLAKPIQQLKQKMENIELNNLADKIEIKSSNNEIEALNNAFQRLRERLDESIRREIRSKTLQMQASFNALQAQVNPHFIYNMLTVLSNKGIENGDDEICEICDGIASMLRYSTSTLEHAATIGEELEYVRRYLSLMKKRFEHRLEFSIDVDSKIYGQKIPKIVLQPIVENSLNHGFQRLQKTMQIDVKGYVHEGWWYIEIRDNGQGFEPDVLDKLRERMRIIDKEFLSSESHERFAIGGMGLINTYARLLLFYNRNFIFKIENLEEGARVIIGALMDCDKGVKSCDNHLIS